MQTPGKAEIDHFPKSAFCQHAFPEKLISRFVECRIPFFSVFFFLETLMNMNGTRGAPLLSTSILSHKKHHKKMKIPREHLIICASSYLNHSHF